MLFLAVLALALLTVQPAGGSFTALSELRLSGRWLLLTALALQVLLVSVLPTPPTAVAVVLHLGSYLAAGVFLFRNRALPGLGVLAAGGLLNAVAIAANHGTMPASNAALRLAGIQPAQDRFANSAVVTHPHLALLGDVFAVPAGLIVSNVFSVGDVLLCVGGVWLLHAAAGCRWTVRRAAVVSVHP